MRERIHRRLSELTVEALDVHAAHRVISVGVGGGHELALLIERAHLGAVVGVDASGDAIERARRAFAHHLASARLDLFHGDVTTLPFPDEMFDRACSVDAVSHWGDPIAALRQLRRVLRRAGRIALSAHARATMEGYALYSPDELKHLVERAGFHALGVRQLDHEHAGDVVIVVATR